MRYGYFDDEHREYVITRPDTPLPWINYLGNRDYFGLISNTAGGYSFYRDARLRRISRYRYNNVPPDSNGRYIYLRDQTTGEFWSPTWQPTRRDVQEYSCRHGLGYTIIASTYHDIRAEVRYFVPLDANLEIWQLTLVNRGDAVKHLSVFSSIEFCLWDAQDDATNFQRNLNTGEVEVMDGVIYHKTEYRERRNHFAFFACSEPLSGFDTQRESFLGAYRGWDNPRVVEKGESTNSIAHGWAPMGSHHIQIELAPHASHQVIFLLGYHENLEKAKFNPPDSLIINKHSVQPILAKYLQATKANAAFDELQEHWNRLLAIINVKTPDEHTNRMVNIWNAYQCMVTFNLSRSASYFESGIGRGMGFRDSNQDLLGFVQMIPERARERILDLAATQLESGGAYHQYQPLTKRGNDVIGSNFNDDHLWLILSVAAYLKETGDMAILDVRVPYENRPESETPLYEHLQRSFQYTLDRLGPHGLPLVGTADWNDCLNLNAFSETPGEAFQKSITDGKTAESLMIAGQFIVACGELAETAARCGHADEAARYRSVAETMRATILRDGWDGEWFLRAYDNSGNKVGSIECEEGKIFVESQVWCVMGHVGLDNGYAACALESVNQYLATPHGILLQQPAYKHYQLHLGEMSSYPLGYKENAAVFCHTNPWVMIAETILGHGNRAYDYYLRINPSAREAISDVHRCEPYVYSQMIAGRDAPTHGEAKNSWLTGSAAWNFVAITQCILGIHPTFDGLQIAPVIPLSWNGFDATRVFRGVTYVIQVKRLGEGNTVSLIVDGKAIAGNIVPLPRETRTHVDVKVHLK